MRRAARPLSTKAVRKANKDLYGKHPGDPRLFDEQGKRKPLDPCDPKQADLRGEWLDLYEKHKGTVEEVDDKKEIRKHIAQCRERTEPKQAGQVEGTGGLEVTVFDDHTYHPLEKASIEVVGQPGMSGLTDAQGRLIRGFIPPRCYELAIRKEGYIGQAAQARVVQFATTEVQVQLKRLHLYFAIYYRDPPDESFRRAAVTWRREVKRRGDYRQHQAEFLLEEVSREPDFVAAWGRIRARAKRTGRAVVEGHVFTHASIRGESSTGLEFRGEAKEDKTLTHDEIAALPGLDWLEDGLLVLHGCHSGSKSYRAVFRRDWAPAEVFAKNQKVQTVGQMGRAYFSTSPGLYREIDLAERDIEVYLWAFSRAANAPLGDGRAIDGAAYLPNGSVAAWPPVRPGQAPVPAGAGGGDADRPPGG